MAGDDHPHFQGYMESLASKEAEDAEFGSQMKSHQEWLENSWGGYVVRTLQRVGDNRFIHALADAFKDQDGGNSVSSILLKSFARISIVVVVIISIYAVGKLLQMITGKEILVEQDVVVIEEVRQSDLKKKKKSLSGSAEKNNGKHTQTVRRRNARERQNIAS
uniref:Uncharacterized protein n=1 Tax=Odontella aurita TaxID=265563 RepID=A0A7S4HKH0_9STRA|mmetsp:Transcript_11456/g.33778  ORF Transcript_11456/g.33778 Transcript_11456/m.33778 type:complete len:163 (+) Transcript_11456:279-767(+)|eukprot:CAMPEP_0113529772 /NCGR_PEP_ID=MMETSP0015_2-20120614/2574_1 /TAXON_ID=2838 /ORGANISM="Odontella" /LENGTH=162 /DNA_ID=CAMNT_0000428429 /DNA_START=279 /DNA_END=767 /DNA_ORIENTATION=- /assembly_acc=CAM_ASM_000160